MSGIRDNKKYYITLLVIIFIQCVYMTVIFGTKKMGYHSDELWNYGFANSSDGAHVFQEDYDFVPKNQNVWLSSKILKDYITVDSDEIFAYDAIYRNAVADFNPPLGNMMLHFICSFFIGKWSEWYGFILNIFCFIITQIYLYRLVVNINNSNMAGLCACLFYGFTMGAVNINIFLRIYAPAVMFGVMFMYYAGELYNKRKESGLQTKLLIKIFMTAFLGCFTLHLFLPFAFIITLMYCIYYIFTKRFKLMLQYGITMVLSVLASLAVFPATIRHLIGNEQPHTYMDRRYPADLQLRIYGSYLTNDMFGVHTPILRTMTLTYIAYAIFVFVIIAIPICFLLRNEEKFRNFVRKTCAGIVNFIKKIRNFHYTVLVLFTTVIFMLAMAAFRTSAATMGRYCTRYIFMIYPILAALAVAVICFVCSWIIKNIRIRYIVISALCIIFAALSMYMAPKDYYFIHKESGKTLTQLENNANCIVVLNEPWVITCFANEICDTKNYFLANYNSAMENTYATDAISSEEPLYLLLDTSNMDGNGRDTMILGVPVKDEREYVKEYFSKEYTEYFEGLDITTKCEHVGSDAVFGRTIEIYRLN